MLKLFYYNNKNFPKHMKYMVTDLLTPPTNRGFPSASSALLPVILASVRGAPVFVNRSWYGNLSLYFSISDIIITLVA